MSATLITGGSGFLGNYLAKELVNQGEKVVMMYSSNPNLLPYVEEIEDKVEKVKGDLSSWTDIFDTIKKYNVSKVYHSGAFLSHKAEGDPVKAFQVNLLGTWYILEAARLFDIKQVIFVSTIASFGDHITDPVSNFAPQLPHTMYGVTKVSSERLGEYYWRKFNIDFRGVRFPSVIGPGRGPGGVSAYSTLIVEKPALGEEYNAFVEPRNCMPLLYIDDAIKALTMLSEVPEEKLNCRMYNIQGFSPTAGEMVEEIKKNLPDAKINFKPEEPMVKIVDSWPNELDDSEAKKDWGWKADFKMEEAIEDFITKVREFNKAKI